MKTLLLLIIILSVSVYSQDGDPIKPIVGGTSVNIADYPYQVSLQSRNGAVYFHFCGGSIINKDWILSAAHCVPTTDPEDLYIRIGFTELSSSDGQIFKVEEIILHPNHNDVTYDNDIALIKLKTSINFNSLTADSVRLATKQDENSGLFPEGTPAFVTGWGHTSFGGFGSNVLQMGEVDIISNNTVMNVWGSYVGVLTNNMLAAGIQAGGVDACQGDSGGPLVVVDSDNGDFVQVGVVSWGDGCAEEEKPGVYAKVSNYTNWINSYVYPIATSDSDFSDFPNQGDGNGDGIRDDLQVNVETIKDFANNTFITIEAPLGVTLNEVNSVSPIASDKFTFPFGLFEFKITSSFAVVKLYFHGISDLKKYAYHKLFPDNRLRIFDNAVFSSAVIDGKEVAVVTLTLTDGGAGDFDGIVNGIIYDPGGPGIPITANIPIWDWWYALILIPIIIYSYKRYGAV